MHKERIILLLHKSVQAVLWLFFSLIDFQTEMLIFIITALVVASAALEEDDCKKGGYKACVGDKTSDVPGSEEEFDEKCPIFLEEFRCLEEYALKCYPEFAEEFTARYEILQELCRKDSHLHETIVKNIGCIKESVTEECSEKIMTVLRAYIHSLNETSDWNFPEEYWTKVDCMHDAYAITCAADSASRQCGSIVKAPLLQMARRSGLLEEKKRCPRNERQEIVKDIPDMDISIEQKLLLEQLLLQF